jgi:hypothetical protein
LEVLSGQSKISKPFGVFCGGYGTKNTDWFIDFTKQQNSSGHEDVCTVIHSYFNLTTLSLQKMPQRWKAAAGRKLKSTFGAEEETLDASNI